MDININAIMQEFIDKDASDLYLTAGSPPSLRFGNDIRPFGATKLSEEDIQSILRSFVTEEIIEEFNSTLEYNTAIDWRGKARLRVNIFKQRQHTGIVLRRIRTDIPTLDSLTLPPLYGEMIMEKRGLILLVGPTGSGKSTSMASMIEHRNLQGTGHIVTIEDPIEFIHENRGCIITQRDVGVDTYSFGIGLKNALRQTPDVIVIGEIRDKETMEHAIVFSETGHLCLATLHSNNTSQTIERILNFFPEERHPQILSNLSFNLRAILSQRLVRNKENSRSLALEIMLNQGLIKSLIHEGRVKEIKECIEKGAAIGMRTFDQDLFNLYTRGIIDEEAAVAESDNPTNLQLAIKQHNLSKPGPFQDAIATLTVAKSATSPF